MNFNEMNLIKPILRAVEEQGFTAPSPIQEQSIPQLLEGRDMLGCAQTGTGKTAAFALPILQHLSKSKSKNIRALIVTPTRELAIQIQENIEKYSKYTSVRSGVIFGGVGQKPQVDMLRKGVDILVATPGRLNDLVSQGVIKLNKIEIFVLDEADRMLDMGFIADIKRILKQLPAKRQTLLFSATMPKEIEKLASGMLRNPAKVKVAPVTCTADKVSQCVYYVDKKNKICLLTSLLKKEDIKNVIVFTNTKHGADKVVKLLSREGITALAIHGGKGQTARQTALKSFKEGSVNVLVATDIAARGIDVAELSHVINYDLPDVPETYIHRIGRTGRAGLTGNAINFCNFDDLQNLRDIERHIGKPIEEMESKWPMVILEKTEKQVREPRAKKVKKDDAMTKTEHVFVQREREKKLRDRDRNRKFNKKRK
ncbi:MAG: DEAD/DEAH box helicase [bacterium]|nr:DEAD/DEAH box helicase [bacterium]